MAGGHAFLLLLVTVAFVQGMEIQEREPKHSLDKRFLKCKPQNASCRGFPRCCENLHCYWEKGYSIFKAGTCVECVDRGQKCQRDAMCCEPLVCQRSNRFHVDGTCDVRRENGASCHKNNNCASKNCDKKWYHFYGTCQA